MKTNGPRAQQLASELYEQQKADRRAAAVAAGLRLFSVSNETGYHLDEVEAYDHEGAARAYRVKYQIRGYARLVTKDAEVFFKLREDQFMLVQHTYEPNPLHPD